LEIFFNNSIFLWRNFKYTNIAHYFGNFNWLCVHFILQS
jgi:hypothetical protein